MSEIGKILKDNGLSYTADFLENNLSGSGYYAGAISEDALGSVLSEDIGAPGGIDLDSIAFQLFMEREANAGIPKGTHNATQILNSEVQNISSKLKISEEEARKLLDEEIRSYLETVAVEQGVGRALDLGQAIYGKKHREVKSIKKPEKIGFSFGLDLKGFDDFIKRVSKIEFLKKSDAKQIKDDIFEKEILNQVGQAVKDVIIEEFLSDDNKLKKTNYGKKLVIEKRMITAYLSTLANVSTDIQIALESINWFRDNVFNGSYYSDFRRLIADLGLEGRVVDIMESISLQFDKISTTLNTLSVNVKMLLDEAKKLAFKYLRSYLEGTLVPIEKELDSVVFALENFILRIEGGSVKSRKITTGSQMIKGISSSTAILRRASGKISTFLHGAPENYMQEISFEAGVAKLDSAYTMETKSSNDKVTYLFSVSDRVTSALRGLGMDNETVDVIRAAISNYIFGRPMLVEKIESLIENSVIKNFESAIS